MQTLWLLALLLRARAAHHASTSSSHEYDKAVDNGTFGYYPSRAFMTEDGISAPHTNWLQWDEQCDDGKFYFLTPKGWSIPQPGPMILDSRGDLVWSKHFANEWGGTAYDLMVQRYRGQDYLTFWTGDDQIRGHGSGTYMMLDSSYEMIQSVDAGNNLTADLHEFLLTPEGTALMTIYQKQPYDMSEWRSFDAALDPNDADPNWIWDCVMQEVSVDTRDVLFEWRASDHFSVNETYHLVRQTGNHEDPFDWFHMNSIHKDELGNYLVSARYTHSITYIDGETGDVIWVLGGKNNMFMDLSNGSAINFAWQHDARFVSPEHFKQIYTPPTDQPGYSTRLLSLFDNAAEDQNYIYGTDHSRGLLVEVTFPTPDHGDAADTQEHVGSDRDISQLWELAELSDRRMSLVEEHTRPELPYPLYDTEKMEDPDADLAKKAQINGTSPTHTVRVIQSYSNPLGVRSSSQGSMQILPPDLGSPSARVLVGYGLNAVFTEFNANGSVACDAHFGAVTSWERGDIQSYRVYKLPWIGMPKYKPRMVIDPVSSHVFVSWNGATQVATWMLQASNQANSSDESAWTELTRRKKVGFETSFDLSGSLVPAETHLRIVALDADGRMLDHGITDSQERGLVTPLETSEPDSQPFGAIEPATLLLCGCIAVAVLVTLYEVYRRYLCWKVGRPAMGAVRWRKGSGYRLLGDA